MSDDEPADDLTTAIQGVLDRELRSVEAVNGLSAESDIVFTHRFPAATVSFEALFRIMLRAAGALDEPGFDKTRWLLHFVISGQKCRLRWSRGGIKLDLYPPIADDDPESAASTIERRIVNGARQIYRRVIAPRVDEKMTTGDVTVMNQYRRYRGMVDFFISEIHDAAAPVPERDIEPSGNRPIDIAMSLTRAILAPAQTSAEQPYRATALVAGYFSWVQHLLVTLTSFSPRALDEDFSLDDLLTAPWAEQFDQAYPKPHDAANVQLKSNLSSLARDFRNPLLHGGGGRYEDGVVVEWAPGNEIVAVDPDSATDLYMLWQPSLSTAQVEDLLERVANVDRGFAAHPFFEWVSSGIPASFARADVQRALAVIETRTVAEYIAAASDAFDDAINWDD